MHFRNGREAKNGDKIVTINGDGSIAGVGVLHSAVPGNDYCNGRLAALPVDNSYVCMCDALHFDDLAALLKEKGWDKRPAGK